MINNLFKIIFIIVPISSSAMSRAPSIPEIGFLECSHFIGYECDWNHEKGKANCDYIEDSEIKEESVLIEFHGNDESLITVESEGITLNLKRVGREGLLGFHGWTFIPDPYDGMSVISLSVPSEYRETHMLRWILLGDTDLYIHHATCSVE